MFRVSGLTGGNPSWALKKSDSHCSDAPFSGDLNVSGYRVFKQVLTPAHKTDLLIMYIEVHTSLDPPTLSTATPDANLANLSCSFSFS
jgi:hypothetical protein